MYKLILIMNNENNTNNDKPKYYPILGMKNIWIWLFYILSKFIKKNISKIKNFKKK